MQNLPEEEFDTPLGTGSGGGLLFGTTGGVMEAALRTVYEIVTGQPMGRILFEVRGAGRQPLRMAAVGKRCDESILPSGFTST